MASGFVLKMGCHYPVPGRGRGERRGWPVGPRSFGSSHFSLTKPPAFEAHSSEESGIFVHRFGPVKISCRANGEADGNAAGTFAERFSLPFDGGTEKMYLYFE